MRNRIPGINYWPKGFEKCPDCGGTKFLKGPEGGNCINFKCAQCGAEFNDMLVFGVERIGKSRLVIAES